MHNVLRKSLICIILLSLFVSLFNFTTFAETTKKSSFIVMEEKSNRVLYASLEHERLPMASTTKIATAIVVLEHSNLNDVVTIPKSAEGVEGSSVYLKAGDKYTVRDLLYGLMLRSGNDCAVALALHVSGSIESFSKLMNDKALSVGAFNTNFTNPHGLHDENHYTTAYDLALITADAYKNTDFREIVSSKKYNLQGQYIYNKNKLLGSYEGADGVKTGYTTKSGRCLVSSSTRNGMRVICVVLNCYDMWERSMKLMTQAHEEYNYYKILDKTLSTNANVVGGIEKTCKASTNTDVYYPLKESEIDKLSFEYELQDLIAPIYANQICGNVKVYLDKCLIFEQNIYTINNVRKKTFLDWLNELVMGK